MGDRLGTAGVVLFLLPPRMDELAERAVAVPKPVIAIEWLIQIRAHTRTSIQICTDTRSPIRTGTGACVHIPQRRENEAIRNAIAKTYNALFAPCTSQADVDPLKVAVPFGLRFRIRASYGCINSCTKLNTLFPLTIDH
jgi:hypothetical protein